MTEDRCRLVREDGRYYVECEDGKMFIHPEYKLPCYDRGDHLVCHVDDPSQCPEGTFFIRKAPIWQEVGRFQCFVKKK